MKDMFNEAKEILYEIIRKIPENKRRGLVIYIYESLDDEIFYEYVGVVSEINKTFGNSLAYCIDGVSFEDIKSALEQIRANDKSFDTNCIVFYGIHAIYKTPCIKIRWKC